MHDQEIRAKALEINAIWEMGLIHLHAKANLPFDYELINLASLKQIEDYIRDGVKKCR